MYPYISVMTLKIPSYWLMGVVGIGVSLVFLLVRNRKVRLERDDLLYLLLMMVVGALVGSKLLYLLTALPVLIPNARRIFLTAEGWMALFQNGFVFYGGFLGALAATFWYCRRYMVSLSKTCALFVPAIPLFHTFGRLGCFLAGCCWGREASWGIAFTHSLAAPNNVPLVPVQLWEATGNLLLFIALVLIQNHRAKDRAVEQWNPFPLYIVAYGVLRFVLEFFRGDSVRGVAWLSTSQWIAAGLILVVAVRFLHQKRKEGKRTFVR